jgi:OOP family OmpA-OmpF porin
MLRRILKYQAEQVFLIQKRSGLLIEHVSIENAVTKDSDAVSAMLTAIESFVVESFTKNEREEGLDRITVGERIIYLEHGPYAVVAAVIRGVAPPEYRHTLKEINEELHALEPQHLQSFDGNTQDAPVIRPFLLRGLEREYITADVAIEELPPKTINTKKQHKKWFLWTILSMLLLGILGLFIQHQRQHVQLEKLLNLLATTPGIMISHTVTSNKPWQLHGLRDPNAVNPQLLAQKFSAIRDQLQFHLEPFISLDERVVTSRAIAELKIPHSIHTRVAGSVLHLSGFVPLDWYLSFVNTQPSIAGISRLDTSQLRLNPTDRVNLLLAFGIDKQQLDFRGDVIIVNKTVASRIQQRLIPILQALDLKHAIKLTYQ